jgi:DNA repair exonuclease SbcCD ATPase subunit
MQVSAVQLPNAQQAAPIDNAQTRMEGRIVALMQNGNISNATKSQLITEILAKALGQNQYQQQYILLLERQHKILGLSIDRLLSRKANLIRNIQALSQRMQTFKKEKENTLEEHAKLHTKFTDLNQENESLVQQQKELKAKCSHLEEYISTLELQIDSLEKEKNELKEGHELTLNELQFLKSENVSCFAREQELKRSLAVLQAEFISLQREKELISQQLKEKQEAYDSVVSHLQTRNHQYEKLQKTSNSLEVKVKEAKAKENKEAYLAALHPYRWISHATVVSGSCLLAASVAAPATGIILTGIVTHHLMAQLDKKAKDSDRKEIEKYEKLCKEKNPNASATQVFIDAKQHRKKERKKILDNSLITIFAKEVSESKKMLGIS